MIPTNFQRAEIRDSNDNIIQQGAYGKNSALSNATNDGWIDYVMNNLEALKGESDQAATVEYVDETLTNYATLESPALTGTPTAPTPTADDDSTKVATTEFVQDAKGEANAYTDTKIAAEVTRSDGAYLPFTGGSITGNLSVSGTITGDVTGDVNGNVIGNVTGDLTGNADTATNATNDGNGDEIATTYLPLSGGIMTGNISNNNANDLFAIGKDPSVLNQGIKIYGGNSFNSGASLYVYGKDNASYGGMFQLFAHDGTNSKELRGTPNGELTWNGNDITPQTATDINTATEVSVANNTIKNLLSFQLTKGTWLVQIAGIFLSNATGYREMWIGSTASSGTIDRYKTTTSNAVSGTVTRLSLTTAISVASTTTYYLNVKQTSGGALNVGGGVRMFRLSSIN